MSSPWMPPVCDFCKEIGHTAKRCSKAPKSCSHCASPDHVLLNCPSKPKQSAPTRKTRRGRSKEKQKWVPANAQRSSPAEVIVDANPLQTALTASTHQVTHFSKSELVLRSQLGTGKDIARGESSTTPDYLRSSIHKKGSGSITPPHTDVQPDSSDTESSDSELEEGEFSQHELDFQLVGRKKSFSGFKGSRGWGPKLN